MPFSDEDYRRRKPHPNFKDMIALEKNVIKFGKTVSLYKYIMGSNFAFSKAMQVFLIWHTHSV